MLLTIRPAAGEAAEEGLADVTVGEEEREDSAGLAAASRATRRLIRRAFKTARPGEVGRPALEAVNRRETGERSNEKPFYAGQKVATIRKYSQVWTKILRYIWRTDGKDSKPDYELTPGQAARLRDLQQSVTVDRVGEDDEGEVRAGGRRAARTAAPATKAMAAVAEEASLEFWIATHNSCAGLYQSHFITNRKRYRVVPELHQSHFINPIYIPISNRFKIKAKRKGRSSRQARIHFYSKKW